jgi:excisionase family DNA binding protein
MPTEELKYLTRNEVCKILHVSLPTLSEYYKKGKIPAYKVGKRVLFKPADIEAVLTKIEPVKVS